MKNIIDLCNVNIPNSLHSLYEASILGDLEDTIKIGDNYAKTMSEISKELKVLQKMKWNTDWTTTVGEHQYEWYCPKFIEHYLGVKAHSLLFTVNLYNSGRGEHDCDTQMFIYDKINDYYSISYRDFICNSKIYSTETKMIKAIVDEIKNKFKEDNLSRTMIRLKDLIKLERFEKVNESSILGDIEDTMKAGDDYVTLMNNIEKEFNLIKKLTINTFRKGNDEYKWHCPNFLKHCIGSGDYITFTLNIYGDDDNGGDYFVDCGMFVVDEKNLMNSNDIDCVSTGEVFKTATLAVEDLVKNIKNEFKFKNLKKLVKYIKTNTKMSKLDLSWD